MMARALLVVVAAPASGHQLASYDAPPLLPRRAARRSHAQSCLVLRPRLVLRVDAGGRLFEQPAAVGGRPSAGHLPSSRRSSGSSTTWYYSSTSSSVVVGARSY